MLLRFILLSFVMGHSLFPKAQIISIQKQVSNIDSLKFYNHLQQAENQADSLNKLLSEQYGSKEYSALKLSVMLHQADIYALKYQFAKATKLAFKIIDLARDHGLPEKEYQANLIIAVAHEQAEQFKLCKIHLDRAYHVYLTNNLYWNYGDYCIRASSYHRFVGNMDSARRLAYTGLEFATKYPNPTSRNLSDAYLLLGVLLLEQDYQKAINFNLLAAREFLKRNDRAGAASMYNRIARYYSEHQELDKAFLYNDSALLFFKNYSLDNGINYFALQTRANLFELVGNKDSALYYFKDYHNAYIKSLESQESIEIKNITEQYENDKKEVTIKLQDLQLTFIFSLLVIIIITTLLVVRKNRKINSQNKIINQQLEELMKTLDQKQVLLSELQHRVKNNLQHVISILELQKESANANNIEELIRSTQNRIHSMALLHKKLNVSDIVNEVDLEKYISALTELVVDSYNNHKSKVQLNITCELATISVEKAMPIGLMIVELVSNSLKHAFKKRAIGNITITITQNNIYYADNGTGYDFNSTTKRGLGLEIIKGLIDQMYGTVETNNNNGFELLIHF